MTEEFKKGMAELIAFKSISTDVQYLDDISKTVDWLTLKFVNSGFEVEKIQGDTCNPIVFATYHVADDSETVFVYGHYDVQPASKENGWLSEPFTLTEREGRLFGRGVVDNKGQFWIHMYTVLSLIKRGKLKYNVKFLLEGNEETANPDMRGIIERYVTKFKADHYLVSDGELLGDNPVIESLLRGGLNMRIKYITAKHDVHSGLYGGAVPNAANELAKFVANLTSDENQISVPGFYEPVDEITELDLENNKKISDQSAKGLFEHAGFKAELMEEGNDFFTQIGMRPTIQVTGFSSGYVGEGFANIVPAEAEVRLNFRTVHSQSSKTVVDEFKAHVHAVTPEYVDYEIEVDGLHEPVKIDTSKPMMKEVGMMLEVAYGKEVLMKPVGGAIPFVGDIKEILGADTLLISLGNDDCNMHGPNESFRIDLVEKGLKFSEMFFGK